MAELKKFLFDFDFDDVQLMEEIVQEETVAVGQPPEEADIPVVEEIPSFSEEEMDAARQEAYEKGKAEAQAETLAGIENNLVGAMTNIGVQVADVFRIQNEYNEIIRKETGIISMAVSRKLFPGLNEKGGFEEVVRTTEEVMSHILQEPRMSIRVREDYVDQLRERLEAHLSSIGFRGILAIRGDDDIEIGGCRVEWQSGYAERTPSALLDEISAILGAAQIEDAEKGPEDEDDRLDETVQVMEGGEEATLEIDGSTSPAEVEASTSDQELTDSPIVEESGGLVENEYVDPPNSDEPAETSTIDIPEEET